MKLPWDYAIRGMLDGTLATLGVVIGARGAHPEIIVAAGVSGGVANSLSNVLAAFSAQKTIMLKEIDEVEGAMVNRDLHDTYHYKKKRKNVRMKSIFDGVATIIGALVPVLPYLVMEPGYAIYLAIGITAVLGFGIGYVMGSISKSNVLLSGLKMAFIAIIVAIASSGVQNGLQFLFQPGT